MLHLWVELSNNLVCKVLDNGIGIIKSQSKKKKHYKGEKFGLKLAKDRIDLINETYKTKTHLKITDISDKNKNTTGTLVEIIMPMNY